MGFKREERATVPGGGERGGGKGRGRRGRRRVLPARLCRRGIVLRRRRRRARWRGKAARCGTRTGGPPPAAESTRAIGLAMAALMGGASGKMKWRAGSRRGGRARARGGRARRAGAAAAQEPRRRRRGRPRWEAGRKGQTLVAAATFAAVAGMEGGPEGPVVGMARLGDLALDLEELAVVDPDARHFVHEHQSALERVIDRLEGRVGDAFVLDAVSALPQIHVPQLVASRQSFESSLKKKPSNLEWSFRLSFLRHPTSKCSVTRKEQGGGVHENFEKSEIEICLTFPELVDCHPQLKSEERFLVHKLSLGTFHNSNKDLQGNS